MKTSTMPSDFRQRVPMSYSRWTNSDWYTIWCVQDDATENRDTALFQIVCCATFTAKQLREDLKSCLDRACDPSQYDRLVSRSQLEGFVAEFLEDVDAKYPAELAAHD